MFETRDFIEEKSEINRDLSQRYQNAERTVDVARKKIRYERKKKLEQEIVQARQDKIEKRMIRTNEASQNVNQSLRTAMMRSEKPRIIKHQVAEKVFTQEELDYERYVVGETNDNPKSTNTTPLRPRGSASK